MAIIIYVWEALGMALSYDKGQYGESITWIGGEFMLMRDSFKVQVEGSIIQDIVTDLKCFRIANKISLARHYFRLKDAPTTLPAFW